MTGPCFVDTNVLLYAEDPTDPAKREIARQLIRSTLFTRIGRLSTQVLIEFFAVATRKLGLDAAMARRRVEIYSSAPVLKPTLDDVLAAIDLHRLHRLSIWDALIIRSAHASGCSVLYTEDLQHGQRFDGLEVIDPFAEE